MGRIKTAMVKRWSNELVKKHSDKISTKFDDNKSIVANHLDVQSKKIRNIIAGYVTRLKRKATQ